VRLLVLGCAAVSALGAFGAGLVVADPAAADRAAAEAAALFRDGKFAAAAGKFREAWQADKVRPELFCNIGISFYKARDLVRAHLLLGQCLEQAALEPKFVDAARSALASVEAALRSAGHTPVRIAVEPVASAVAITELDPDGSFLGSRVVWLPFGRFHIAAHAEGYTDAAEEVTTASQEPKTVTITLERVPGPPPGPGPVDHGQGPGPGPGRIDQPGPEVPASPPSRLPAYAATGVTAVALGVAVVAYVKAHSRADLGATALDAETLQADRDAVSSWNTTMGVAGAVAIASAAASGYLWYRALHGVQVEVHPAPGGGGVSLSGRF
jgi:hypothetical protein